MLQDPMYGVLNGSAMEMPMAEDAPCGHGGDLVKSLIALASLLKELETQSHLIHLNYEAENFLEVHQYLKGQYELHLEEFDTVAEFVRAMDHFMPMCACGLKDVMPPFKNVSSYEPREMLVAYLLNLDTLSELATEVEQMAGEVRQVDVQNYMAELVAAANKACWFLKAMLRNC